MSVKRFDMHGESHVNGKYADGEVAQELYDALEQAKRELEEIAMAEIGEPYSNLKINSALAKARGEQ